jgi:Plavaka transposase
MFVPIILESDKTTVSVATGNNEYWPVYLSIGNIHNNVRRAHQDGLVLLEFLAVPKSKCKVVMRSWFFINNTIKPTKSILIMLISANSAVSYIIPPSQKFLSLSSPA